MAKLNPILEASQLREYRAPKCRIIPQSSPTPPSTMYSLCHERLDVIKVFTVPRAWRASSCNLPHTIRGGVLGWVLSKEDPETKTQWLTWEVIPRSMVMLKESETEIGGKPIQVYGCLCRLHNTYPGLQLMEVPLKELVEYSSESSHPGARKLQYLYTNSQPQWLRLALEC